MRLPAFAIVFIFHSANKTTTSIHQSLPKRPL
jgi:hypothetical protein